jgi:hypothetical protein
MVRASAGRSRRIVDRIGAMHFAENDEFVDPISRDEAVRVVDPRQMTRTQLRYLGMPRLVYLRCVTVDGQEAFAIHAADGTSIAVVEDLEVALEVASESNMVFVAVH